MQRIEKYGVIALVFLLVTILAVSLWSQKKGKSPFAWFKHDATADTNLAQNPNEVPQVPPGQSTSSNLDSHPIAPLNPDGTPQPTNPQPTDPRVAQTPLVPPTGNPTAGNGTNLGNSDKFSNATNASNGNAVTNGTNLGNSFTAGAHNPGGDASGATSNGGPTNAAKHTMSGDDSKSKQLKPTSDEPKLATRSYTVQHGETLGKIAAHELGSFSKWTEIAKLNGNLDPKKVHAGMKLNLPANAKSAVESKASKSAPKESKGEVTHATEQLASYTVKKGDTLSSIATKTLGNSGRWTELKKLNPSINPDRLVVGAKLRVPESSGAKSSGDEVVASVSPKHRVQ